MESLQHKAARTSPRPALALVLAGSMLVVPALILAHGRQAVARVSTLAEPAAVIPLDRNLDGAATRSVDRYAFAVVDPGPTATVAAPPATETSITTGPTTTRVVRTVKRTSTPTTALRRVVPRTPPAPPTTVPTHSEVGQASWYDGPSGSCAHPYLPIGTVITVTNVATGASATCTVGGRGPYGGSNRIVDLDKATFAKLAPLSAGVVQVRITW